jgi:adenosylhomocysteine nucleosidase
VASSEIRPEVLICFAVKEEAAEFKKILPNLASLGNPEVLVTGMGKKKSERAILERIGQSSPNLVLTCGFAGALNPKLEIGDVLFDADSQDGLAEMLQAAGAESGKFYCASHVATTAAEKTALRQSTGADAVEMESAVIREICRKKNIPSATIRVISDTANQDLPLDFNALMTPEQTISFPKLALALIKSPAKIPRLLELQRNTRYGARQLARVLGDLLRSRNRGV